MMCTRLENLPNEVFFIIYTHFNDVDLCLTFYNLNTCIHRLLDNVASHRFLGGFLFITQHRETRLV
jgi:hypothetical protein